MLGGDHVSGGCDRFVWVQGKEPVQQCNECYILGSCKPSVITCDHL